MVINDTLVKKLISSQFPQWADLPVIPVAKGGYDNRTFHLGNEMLVRLPSGEGYAAQVEKEWLWLPKLSPHISLPITRPIAKGNPTDEYLFPWSVINYIEGETVNYETVGDMKRFAVDLAMFLKELQAIDTTDAPEAGQHNFYRGGDLSVYDEQTQKTLDELKGLLPVNRLSELWDWALDSRWTGKDIWVHGDVAVGNLLVKNGLLCGIIDFGVMGVGDPACDYVMAWTFFDRTTRDVFFEKSDCDKDTIARARGWALWKAMITYNRDNEEVAKNARYTINEILQE